MQVETEEDNTPPLFGGVDRRRFVMHRGHGQRAWSHCGHDRCASYCSHGHLRIGQSCRWRQAARGKPRWAPSAFESPMADLGANGGHRCHTTAKTHHFALTEQRGQEERTATGRAKGPLNFLDAGSRYTSHVPPEEAPHRRGAALLHLVGSTNPTMPLAVSGGRVKVGVRKMAVMSGFAQLEKLGGRSCPAGKPLLGALPSWKISAGFLPT